MKPMWRDVDAMVMAEFKAYMSLLLEHRLSNIVIVTVANGF